MALDKGVFTISIDFEMAWGYADREITRELKRKIGKEPEIVKRLLFLFDKYEIPATWAVVSKLLDKHDDCDNGLWYDTCGLVRSVAEAKVKHEIASHSYAHIIYGDKNTSLDAARTDIAKAAEIHGQSGYSFKSFVFPRNQEGFHDELKKAGIKAFRGETIFPYQSLPKPFDKFGRMLDYYLPAAKTAAPARHESGLVNIPDCMLLLHRKGLRRMILPQVMINKIMYGIKAAIERKQVFHLWFHPFNFTYETRAQFRIFEEGLKYAVGQREKGELEIMTMGEIASGFE